MYKYDEFEIAFTPICDVDVKRLRKINNVGVKYFLDDTIFFILNNGSLLISSGKGKLYLNFDSWETKVNVLCENEKTITVFISIEDFTRGVEYCYESKLDKVR